MSANVADFATFLLVSRTENHACEEFLRSQVFKKLLSEGGGGQNYDVWLISNKKNCKSILNLCLSGPETSDFGLVYYILKKTKVSKYFQYQVETGEADPDRAAAGRIHLAPDKVGLLIGVD